LDYISAADSMGQSSTTYT